MKSFNLEVTTNGLPCFYETKTAVIANPDGSRKQLLFARQKDDVFAFGCLPGDLICEKQGKTFTFYRVLEVTGAFGAELKAEAREIETYKDVKNMPYQYKDLARSLQRKVANKACYYKGASENNVMIEDTIQLLISMKYQTKEAKGKSYQQLLANVACIGGVN